MTHVLRDVLRSLRASPIFAFYVLASLVMAGRMGLITFRPELTGMPAGMNHFGVPAHRVHDLTFGFLFTTSVVGIVAQLRRPSRNIAGMVMALIPWVALLLSAVLSADVFRVIMINPSWSFAGIPVVVALLHPAGRRFFRSFSFSRVNWVMLALLAVAAVPLLLFASTNVRLQTTVTDLHAASGHYGFMAAFGFTVVGVGLLASLRPDGWRLTAWVAGLLPAVLGLASLLYPVSSSLSLSWTVAAIAWGVVFIGAAEVTRDAKGTTPRASQDVESEAARIEA